MRNQLAVGAVSFINAARGLGHGFHLGYFFSLVGSGGFGKSLRLGFVAFFKVLPAFARLREKQ